MWFKTDFSGLPIGPILRVKLSYHFFLDSLTLEDGTDGPETSVSNHLTPVITQKMEKFSSTAAEAYDLFVCLFVCLFLHSFVRRTIGFWMAAKHGCPFRCSFLTLDSRQDSSDVWDNAGKGADAATDLTGGASRVHFLSALTVKKRNDRTLLHCQTAGRKCLKLCMCHIR
jgi:hypothetical protein